MPLITDIDTAWSAPVTLTTAELWQVRRGSVLITSEPITNDNQGFEMTCGDAMVFMAGKTIRVRKQTLGRA